MRFIRLPYLRLLCVLLLAGPLAQPAQAAGWGHVRIADRGGERAGISLDEAASRVADATGGRVLAANRVDVDGRPLYRIKVLTPRGVVRVLWVDPGSGDIVGGRGR